MREVEVVDEEAVPLFASAPAVAVAVAVAADAAAALVFPFALLFAFAEAALPFFLSSPGPSNCGGAGAVGRRILANTSPEAVVAMGANVRGWAGPGTEARGNVCNGVAP